MTAKEQDISTQLEKYKNEGCNLLMPSTHIAGHTLSALTHQQETNRHKATGGIGAGKVTEHSSTGDGSEE